jgi:argininosuccinate lyase
LKALPFAYNRDLQEDKEPLFDSFDTLFLTLPAVTGMISRTNFDRQKMAEAAPKGFSLATEIADYLVRKNIPFAIAHESAGKCVALCEKTSRELDQLTASELHSIHPQLDEGVMVVLSVDGALKSRTTSGGTAPSLVKSQIQAAQTRNDLTRKEISRKVANFSEMMNQ